MADERDDCWVTADSAQASAARRQPRISVIEKISSSPRRGFCGILAKIYFRRMIE